MTRGCNSCALLSAGGSETFQDKVNFFQRELRHIHSKKPRTKTCLKIARHSILDSVSAASFSAPVAEEKLASHSPAVSRFAVTLPLPQSLKATKNFSVSDWSKNFEVVFQDEEGKVVFHSCRKLHLKLLQ